MNISDIPERVKVGPYRYWTIIESKPFASDDEQRVICGQVTHSTGTMRIADGPPHRMFETMLHETLHAIDYLADTELSESQIWRLAVHLAAFLIDNGYVEEPDA